MKITTRISRDIPVKNKGITFAINSPNGQTHVGNLTLTKTKLIWCPNTTPREHGHHIILEDFFAWAEEQPKQLHIAQV